MKLVIEGCKDWDFEYELIKASHFYAQTLLSAQLYPHISIVVKMKTKITDLGNCSIAYYNDWYKARDFEIELRRHRSLKSTLQTLAHEFVHIKQFAKGELNVDHTRWRGEKFDSAACDYNDLPWEVEATSLEPILYHLYVDKRL
jgi:hypothetical protein